MGRFWRALKAAGVFDTLKAAAKLTLMELKKGPADAAAGAVAGALGVQVAGRSTVKTDRGNAAVSRAGALVSVELAGARATVDCASHEERYLSN